MTPRKAAHRIKSLILLVRMKLLTRDTRRLTAALLRNKDDFGVTLALFSRSLKLANRQMRLMHVAQTLVSA